MNQGDSLAVAAGATMALILVSRGLRGWKHGRKTAVVMALIWVAVIVAAAIAAAWWEG